MKCVMWACTTNVRDPFVYLWVWCAVLRNWFFLQVVENWVRLKFDRTVAGCSSLTKLCQFKCKCLLFVYSFFLSFLLPLSLSLKQVCHCSIHWAFHIHSFSSFIVVSLLTDKMIDRCPLPVRLCKYQTFSSDVLTCGGGGFMSSWCILSSLLIYWCSWINEPFTISSSLAVKIWSVSISCLE